MRRVSREGVGDVDLPQLLSRQVQALELLPNEPAVGAIPFSISKSSIFVPEVL